MTGSTCEAGNAHSRTFMEMFYVDLLICSICPLLMRRYFLFVIFLNTATNCNVHIWIDHSTKTSQIKHLYKHTQKHQSHTDIPLNPIRGFIPNIDRTWACQMGRAWLRIPRQLKSNTWLRILHCRERYTAQVGQGGGIMNGRAPVCMGV